MWKELRQDIGQMWSGTTAFERVGLVLFVPIYCVAFVLASVFGED